MSKLPVLLSLLCTLFIKQHIIVVDKPAAQEAFEYLNLVRQTPKQYANEVGAFLNSVKPLYALKWNDTLAKVAEQKAHEMATNNYIGHVDKKGYGMNYYIQQAGYKLKPIALKDKKLNFYESVSGGYSGGKESIIALLIDKNVLGSGHRKHLLTQGNYSGFKDIGIGFARDDKSEYKTFMCILIAQH